MISTAVQTTSFDYGTLADGAFIQSQAEAIRGLMKQTAESVIDIGRRLLIVKKRLPGQFGEWISVEFDWSHDTAGRFMNVAERLGDNPHYAEFKPTVLYALAKPSTPDAAIDEALERVEAGEDLSVADAKKIIARHREPAKKIPHVSQNTGYCEWYTPSEYLDAARNALGEIDLDPASSAIAQKRVKAKKYYTLKQDGLSKPWAGRVFLNPPYSTDTVGKFTTKLYESYLSGNVTAAILLVNNATETVWFRDASKHATAVGFTKERIRFIDEHGARIGTPLQGQAILYYGDDVDGFASAFADLADVYVRHTVEEPAALAVA